MGNDDGAFDRLPEVYAAALRLRNERCSDDEIAERLGVEPEGVPALLSLAQAKLAVIRRYAPGQQHSERTPCARTRDPGR